MKRHWLNRTANALLGVTIIGIAYLAAASYGTANASAQNSDSFQEAPFDLDAVTTNVWLRNAPPPSPQTYDGIGNPIVVVTHTGPGNLHRAIHVAEVWTETAGGVDLCGTTHFLLEEFRIFYPTGGASPSNKNVTYTSDSYSRTTTLTPGSEECALRVEPGKIWHYLVCVEYDGVRSEPVPDASGTTFDAWDRCVEGQSVASSTLYGILPHG